MEVSDPILTQLDGIRWQKLFVLTSSPENQLFHWLTKGEVLVTLIEKEAAMHMAFARDTNTGARTSIKNNEFVYNTASKLNPSVQKRP